MAQLSELLDFAGFGLVCRDYVTLCLAVLELSLYARLALNS